MKLKKCTSCGKVLPLSFFTKKAGKCKTCRRDEKWMSRYGMTPDEYLKMNKEQENRCAICGYEAGNEYLHVDHDHTTGAVRELLCNRCNRHLGEFENLPTEILKNYLNGNEVEEKYAHLFSLFTLSFLISSLDYLERHKCEQS